MAQLRRTLTVLAVLLVISFVASVLVVSAIYVVAIVAPLIGLGYLALRMAAAVELWRSHGKFQLGDAVRIIGAGRARLLGLVAGAEGVAGLALSLVPLFLIIRLKAAFIPALAFGVCVQVASKITRRRVLESAHPVDVLPPE